MSGHSQSSPEWDEPSSSDEGVVRRELRRLRELARAVSVDDLQRGTWLAELVRFSLHDYVNEVDADWFAARYPGRAADEVVQTRIQRAARFAALEGGISAGGYSAAVAATLGSAGGASPLTLPAASTSFVLDLLYTSYLQLRLAHDISVLHRVPLDLQDPEDLAKLVRVAFALKGREAGQVAVGKGVPVGLRPLVSRIMAGGAPAAARSLPAVGQHLLRRNLLKFTLPAVGVPLSMAVNSWSVRVAGTQASTAFRTEGRIVEAARAMTARTEHHAELLWVLWLIVKSDALIHQDERLLLKHVTALVGDLDTELAAIAGLGAGPEVDEKTLWNRLASVTGELQPLYDAGVVAAGIDGTINPNELKNLQKLARYCSAHYDEEAIRRSVRLDP